ncbi:hypothetical protein MBAV_001905 [Candidatus Magnetobacterium bavaricum]|uniref:Uncharacterized protein n=1 Tax=Candidatus Magnetobacterium bavaricum TaxID=29290 RepID=A0A0F3GVH8_9BACT|nr:hypothetical protein MBAV_001905 [Candidatus Magnetobacterium bavaricum]MBF0606490.1 hypothetical protein [Nitrospirota bacterium]
MSIVTKKECVRRIEEIKKRLDAIANDDLEKSILTHIAKIEELLDSAREDIPTDKEERKRRLKEIESESQLSKWFKEKLQTVEKVKEFMDGIVPKKCINYKKIDTIAKHSWPVIENSKLILPVRKLNQSRGK